MRLDAVKTKNQKRLNAYAFPVISSSSYTRTINDIKQESFQNVFDSYLWLGDQLMSDLMMRSTTPPSRLCFRFRQNQIYPRKLAFDDNERQVNGLQAVSTAKSTSCECFSSVP